MAVGYVDQAFRLQSTPWNRQTTNLWIRARVLTPTNVEVPGSPFNLVHRGNGIYENQAWVPTSEGQYVVSYEYFDDATYTTPAARHSSGNEHTLVKPREEDAVWKADINAARTPAGSFGEHLADLDTSGTGGGSAADVWNTVLPGNHDDPDTAGLYMQVIRQFTTDTNQTIHADPVYSLPQIQSNIDTNRITSNIRFDDVDTALTNLSAQVTTEHANTVTEIETNRGLIVDLTTQTTTMEANIIAKIDVTEQILIFDIRPATNRIPGQPTEKSDTNRISAEIAALPTDADIQAITDAQTLLIKGSGDRDLTEVYDNERGTDDALLRTDARIDNLDATVSSRSTLTDALVWNYSNRTLTGGSSLSPTDIDNIWAYGLTSITAVDSIGLLLKTNVDETISSRLGPTDMALIAKQADLLAIPTNPLLDNDSRLIYLPNLVDLDVAVSTRAATTDLPTDYAKESTMTGRFDSVDADLVSIEGKADAIKSKTDNLPSDPAKDSNVLRIPTNPLLDDDPRLNNMNNLTYLDAYITSRTEVSDLYTDYAKESTLVAGVSDLKSDIAALSTSIDSLPDQTYFDPHFAKLDTILVDLNDIKGTGFTANVHSLVAIEDKVVPATSIGIEVWNYATRDLTYYPPTSTKEDVDSAADKTVAELTGYYCGMSTVSNFAANYIEFICWLAVNGVTQTSLITKANIEVDDKGVTIWNDTIVGTPLNGIYYFNEPNLAGIGLVPYKNYTAKVSIEYNGTIYSTTQPFYTLA